MYEYQVLATVWLAEQGPAPGYRAALVHGQLNRQGGWEGSSKERETIVLVTSGSNDKQREPLCYSLLFLKVKR